MKKTLSAIIVSCLMGTVLNTHTQTSPASTGEKEAPAAAEPPATPAPPVLELENEHNRFFAQSGGGGFGGGGRAGGFAGGAGGGEAFQDIFENNIPGWESRSTAPGRTVLVRTGDFDEKSAVTLEEDLKIMARILDKAIDNNRHDESARKAMGITVFGSSGGTLRNLYVEGYGALFLLNVNFPLLAPPEKPEEPKSKEETSTTWEETKNELYGRGDHEGGQKFKVRGRAPEPYDPQKVEMLQESILKSLKNAAHIRKLKGDEFVTIVISGSSAGSRTVTTLRSSGAGVISKTETDRMNVVRFGDGHPLPESTMTIRARKSDIDTFSKDKMELDDFKKTLKISIY